MNTFTPTRSLSDKSIILNLDLLDILVLVLIYKPASGMVSDENYRFIPFCVILLMGVILVSIRLNYRKGVIRSFIHTLYLNFRERYGKLI